MIANLISQISIDELEIYSEDNLPRKIKEKWDSLKNTLDNRYSIPMKASEETKSDSTYVVTTDEEPVVYVSEPAYEEPKIEMPVKEETKSDTGYNIIQEISSMYLDGDAKPINVKEHMIMNMMKKAVNTVVLSDNISSSYDEVIFEPKVEQTIETQPEIVVPTEESVTKNEKYVLPANVEKILSSTFDFDTTVVAINQTREKYMNVSEQADIATQAANESDTLLQKVSSEYEEAEKRLREKEKHSLAMEQKIMSILASEQDRLSQQMQEKETVINDANRRKEENNDKIVDFRSKINSTIEKYNEIDERISRQEELLNSLVGFNGTLDDYPVKAEEEKSPARVA